MEFVVNTNCSNHTFFSFCLIISLFDIARGLYSLFSVRFSFSYVVLNTFNLTNDLMNLHSQRLKINDLT